ncbi:MAG: desulfoferrodoxin [Nanoarchaeota archaeon]|nr:desulfoferrodoxin [Nanoarchaeota archaeon]
MTQKNGLYKCEICGNVVSVIEAKMGELVCCGAPMNLLVEKTLESEGKEKHVPVLEINGNNVKISVGSIEHPMTDEHYIELIEVLADGMVVASYHPSPGEKPIAEFNLEDAENQNISARALCNVHGLWKN